MKRMISILLSAVLALGLTACGTGSTADSDRDTENIVSISTEEQSNSERILIAYFSIPEDVSTEGVDAVAGASIVVSEGEKLGNTQYVAEVIQETVGGDLFRIETAEEYPLDHDPLVDQAAEEQDADLRPALASHVENFEQYETVILGFPNWWGDLPMPVYSFLEEYDFGAKTIIPFVTHSSTAMHYQVAEDHGFTDIADFVVDEDGSVSLPVEGGTQLTENLVGAHFGSIEDCSGYQELCDLYCICHDIFLCHRAGGESVGVEDGILYVVEDARHMLTELTQKERMEEADHGNKTVEN